MVNGFNFSILIPTRHRVNFIHTALTSIYKTIKDKSQVEVLVAYDNDDSSTPGLIDIIKKQYPELNVEWLIGNRSQNMSEDYFNRMARRARGKYIIGCNDDIKFLEKDWDEKTLLKLNDYIKLYPDEIVYGITNDMEVENKRTEDYYFSCFPLISKKAIQILGFFFSPFFFKDGADWDIFGLYKGVNRVLDLRDSIVIEHLSLRAKKRIIDQVDIDSQNVMERYAPRIDAGYHNPFYIEFLKKYIENYKTYSSPSLMQLVVEGKIALPSF